VQSYIRSQEIDRLFTSSSFQKHCKTTTNNTMSSNSSPVYGATAVRYTQHSTLMSSLVDAITSRCEQPHLFAHGECESNESPHEKVQQPRVSNNKLPCIATRSSANGDASDDGSEIQFSLVRCKRTHSSMNDSNAQACCDNNDDSDVVNALLAIRHCGRKHGGLPKPTKLIKKVPFASPNSDNSDSCSVNSDVATNVKLYECPDCLKTFHDHSNFVRHRRSHTGEKPYVCTDCNRAFATSTNLVVHRRVHTGERPYACQHCGDKFVDSGSLRKHVRTHTGERPYVCDVPGCVKAFTRSGDLVVHKRVHTGERPYACDWSECGKSFAQRSTLITHRHSHTGEKPFECVHCQCKFVSTSHLAAHRRLGKCPSGISTF
jgi:uncharacterized Zn-finger protein